MRALTETELQALRVEVGVLRLRERRRTFPARLCLGRYAGARLETALPWPVPPSYDDPLLADLLDALADRWRATGGGAFAVWLVRPGLPDRHDLDVRLAAVVERAELDPPATTPSLLVVTRTGWLDPRTGQSRRWKRLRLLRTDLATPWPEARQSAQV